MTTAEHPVCPTCGQPANEGLADNAGKWECANEACPEYGQVIDVIPAGEFDGGA
jgi:hypothetical protein